MLMAAGIGQRLRPFTDHRTKALLPVLGIPIIQFLVDSLVSTGVKKMVVNVHHRAEETKAGLAALEHPSSTLIVSDESALLLGSAGGLKKATPFLGSGSFFYSVADTILDIDWSALSEAHQKFRKEKNALITLAVSVSKNSGTYREILFDPHTRLITGLGGMEKNRPYFTGAAVLERECLDQIPKDIPSDFVSSLLIPAIEKKRAFVFVADSTSYDIGNPALWLSTHLDLIQMLERTSSVSPQMTRWLDRLWKHNVRLAPGIWASQRAKSLCTKVDWKKNWKPPCYWDCLTDSDTPPDALGPNSVLYGSAISGFTSGIGYNGIR